MLGDLMESVQPVEVKIFGSDQQILNEYANRFSAIVSSVEGTADVSDGMIMTGPYINIKPNATALAQSGLLLLTCNTSCKLRSKEM